MDNKPLYVISVVSEMLTLHPQTIRQYERVGLLKPSRTVGNTRRYSDYDISRLRLITKLTKDMGVNIAGVEIILSMQDDLVRLWEKLDESEGRDVDKVRDLVSALVKNFDECDTL